MEKSVKYTTQPLLVYCSSCREYLEESEYTSPNEDDAFCVCKKCNNIVYIEDNEDDRYYQYIEDHQQMEERLEDNN